ncbi:MAG TPA: hypothetical protein VMI32_04995 [Candidatus Solibacter sp.]|nr:hypothetical protein [Candidatus Solibacter sp.]
MSLSYEPIKQKPPERGQSRGGGFGTITIPGTPVGAIVSVGLVVICWFALPLSHIFILGTGGIGLIVGLLLYWKHRGPRE